MYNKQKNHATILGGGSLGGIVGGSVGVVVVVVTISNSMNNLLHKHRINLLST